MALFDEIYCKMQLPDNAPEFLKKCPAFQTYDLGQGMGDFTISEDGQLLCQSTLMSNILMQALTLANGEPLPEPPPIPIEYKRKRIEMWASNLRGGGPRNGEYVWFTDDGSDYIQVTYVVQIRNGRVSSIKEKSRSVQPARPYAEMNQCPKSRKSNSTSTRTLKRPRPSAPLAGKRKKSNAKSPKQ